MLLAVLVPNCLIKGFLDYTASRTVQGDAIMREAECWFVFAPTYLSAASEAVWESLTGRTAAWKNTGAIKGSKSLDGFFNIFVWVLILVGLVHLVHLM